MISNYRRYSLLITALIVTMLLLVVQLPAVFAAPGDAWAGTLLPAGVYTDSGPNNGFTNQAGETNGGGGCNNGVRSGWWRFTAPATATYIINTNGSSNGVDTILSVWNRPANYPTNNTGRLACDDDSGTGNQSLVSVNLTAGTTYQIRVSSNNNTNGTYVLNITQAPTISVIPNQTTNEDTPIGPISFTIGDAETPADNLTLSATSSNGTIATAGDITFGGSGANRTVSINPNADANGSTNITITVTDANGGTASDTFTLTVNPVNDPPTIGNIPNRTINEDSPMGTITFGIGDPEQLLGLGLTLSATSSNPALVPVGNITLNTLLVLGFVNATPLPNQNGTTTITVTVRDPQGATASDSFVLTVNPINDPPTDITLSNSTVAENALTSAVIGTFTTADVDLGMPNDTHTYTLIDNAGGRFQVVGNQLQVANNLLLDFETNPTHTIIVRTTDAAGLFYTETMTITVTDVVETLSINDVTVTEGHTSTVNAQFTVTLANSSNQTITVNYLTTDVSATAGVDYVGVVTGLVTFAPGVTTQTVDITVNGDYVDENDETYTVDLSGAVGATITDAQGLGTITDDDTAGVTVTPTAVIVTENGLAQTYTVVLNSQPVPSEIVTITGAGFSSEITVSPTMLIFDAANWNVQQVVTVTAVDNFLDDDTRTTTIVHGVASTDTATGYGNGTVTAAPVVVTINDDDVASVIVTPLTVTVTENGLAQTYTAVLTSQPFPNETVTITTSGFSAAITVTATVTLTELNWNVPQVVTVTAVDNWLDDDTRTTTITNGVSSNQGTRYGDGTVTASPVDVTINDDDTAGVTITPTSIVVEENQPAQTYSARLTSQPFPSERITITVGGYSTEITVSPATLTFDETNWNVPQNFSVSAVDNFLDDDTRTTIIANGVGGSDPLTRYGDGTVTAASVTVTIIDNETAGVVVAPTTVTVTENGPAQVYTVILTSQPFPGEIVTITTGGFDATWVAVTAIVTFDATNWNIAQNVTVSAVDNFLDDDTRTTIIANGVSSNQATRYGDGTVTAASVDVTILDDDTAGVTVNPIAVTVTENGAAQNYTLRLTSQPFPGEIVTITMSGWSTTDITVNPVTRTFTAANWNVLQTVTITAVDNWLDDGTRTTTIANGVSSNQGTRYGDGTVTAASVTVMVNDDDVAGVTVNPTARTVNENGAAQTYTLRLTSQPFPGESVTINLSGWSAVDITVSPTTVTFDENNWNVLQTITITPIDNFIDEGNRTTTIAHTVVGSDPSTAYGSMTAASVVVTVVDNDVAGAPGTPTAPTVTEAGAATTYTVTLTSQPIPGEIVTLTLSGWVAVDVTVSPTPLIFDDTNWNIAQTVTVTPLDNLVADGNRLTTITQTFSSSAATPYGNGTATAAPVVVTVNDNDTPGVVISQTALTVTEMGVAQTYTLHLLSQPAAGETVTLNLSGFSAYISVSPTVVTFNAANWTVPQTVTVNAVDNLIADGQRTTTITQLVTGNIVTTPYGSGSVTATPIAVTINDNDVPGVTISIAALPIAENDPGQTYTIVIDTQPAAGEIVTIDISSPSSELTITPISVSFDDTNWNVPQDILVVPVDNYITDGSRTTTIDHLVSSTDTGTPYGNGTVTAASILVTIVDDDVPGLTFIPGSLTLSEGMDGFYRVRLNTQPLNPVSLILDFDDSQILVNGLTSPVVLTDVFSSANWNTGITLSVTALEDGEAEGDETQLITHSLSSGDVHYNIAVQYAVNIVDVTMDTQAVPRCVMLSLEESTIVRAVIIQPITRNEIYCREIVNSREYMPFLGPGNVGSQAVIDMGIIHAVDIFVTYGENFFGGLWTCLSGRGDMVYMNQSGMPRVPQLLESMYIDGFTCTTIPNAGTLVLVDPIDYSSFSIVQVACDIVTTAEVNLRERATTGSAILEVLPYDTTLSVIARTNGWYQVQYQIEADIVTGWVSADWVREATSCEPPAQ